MSPTRLCLLALLALAGSAQAQSPIDYGVLIVSRERVELPTSCDVGLYLQDQLAARLVQGESIAFNLPPGPVAIRLGLLGPVRCKPGIEQQRLQSISLEAGEVRRYRLAMNTAGLYLTPALANP
ncbi:hypothetical protein TUM18999_53630 [Pseudomonas tohonis]|uniref:3-isopropylmalate dehydratase n=1 Tax=Pseudomonas tohonis TaxID=2725477 RepID=A0A6J4EBL0_9PSED|nr:hypothetical protein [Pseudomonas tohonis]BCG27172.1 hypothetical protein TUM18999_53630 [Pseudomonas tohonis]GJN54607.1 hypothetical protein TUM20286_43590 [Pseudomonas tohonis]